MLLVLQGKSSRGCSLVAGLTRGFRRWHREVQGFIMLMFRAYSAA
jgi:hypothetical protein